MSDPRPARRRRPHPADVAAAAEIAKATRFAAHIRRGPFEAYTDEFGTLAEARARAAELTALHGQFGRRCIVYAISAGGARYPVPDDK